LLWKERGIPALASRIGVHTGRVVAGNLAGEHPVKGRGQPVHVFTMRPE
jgi:class 3 adenylate cyclase